MENTPPEKLDTVVNVACNACGADMAYSPEKQMLNCEHCGNTQDLPKASDMVVEKSFTEGVDLNRYEKGLGVQTKVFHCKDCGSETAVSMDTVAFQCPFCDSKNVNQEAHESKVIKPSGILPFKIGKKKALEKFKGWIKKGLFTPNDLKKKAALEKINGVYIPYWTYDAMTYSQWWAEAGYHYYVTQTYTDSEGNVQTRQVQKTRWVPANGYYEHFFDDVLVVGSHGVQQSMADSVAPFSLGEVINYDPKYILGMHSEVYQKDIMQGFQVAEGKMNTYIRNACARQIPGDTYRNLNVNTRKNRITFKHILLPLWIAAYKYKGKPFQFLVNGQTGKISGKKPKSGWKIFFAILLAAIVIGTIIFLLNGAEGG